MIADPKKTEFLELFRQFVEGYLSRPDGRTHLARYEEGRTHGRSNFEKVVAAANRGEDITDLVLRLFLPYTDSAAHRAAGVFIHIAPAITGDVKEWFESVGWTKPEDWPNVAHAILNIARRCAEDIQELDSACREFSALPYTTGFQTGMLTPILNALRPDDFLIINNKSRRVVNYFTDGSFKARLTDYPGVNAAGLALVAELADEMRTLSGTEARPADLLDQFAHWLVAVRKHPFGRVRYWKIAPGENAYLWDEWREKGYIAIGWDELGDVSGMNLQCPRRGSPQGSS
jgi:5-methylcytosine-specific restriction protein B